MASRRVGRNKQSGRTFDHANCTINDSHGMTRSFVRNFLFGNLHAEPLYTRDAMMMLLLLLLPYPETIPY